jgi:hypothetical protein
MPYLQTTAAPEIGQTFDARLNDDGRRALPCRATRVSEHWMRIGNDDLRQIIGSRGYNGETTFFLTSSSLNAAAQARATKLAEAVAAGRVLQAALSRLDPADKGGVATILIRQLSRWLDRAQGSA